MTKKEFTTDVNALIERLVRKAMDAHASSQAIDEQIEQEPIDADSIFVDNDYNDDLRDRYNQLKGG